MPTHEFTHISEPSRGGGLRIIVPLSDQVVGRSRALQESFSERFGHLNLHLPDRDELSLTFARLIVPKNGESLASISDRIEVVKPLALRALREAVQIGDQPFVLHTAFDSLQATSSEVSIVASHDERINELRQKFAESLGMTIDEEVPQTVSVEPIQFVGELPMDEVRAHTNAYNTYFTPIMNTVTTLQLIREARPGKATEIIEEFKTDPED